MNIFICGFFGYLPEQNDGQTIKTRMVRSVFESMPGHKITWYDTQRLRYSFFVSLWKIISLSYKADVIAMLPGENGLKWIFPLLKIISWLRSSRIIYIVIGGWLPIVTRNNRLTTRMLKKIDHILVETNAMKKELDVQGFINVSVLNNFKPKVELPPNPPIKDNSSFCVVFISRILREKGIYELIRAIEELSQRMDITCDFYGPLDAEDTDKFLSLVAKSQVCHYKGVLPPDQVVPTMTQYHLFAFPTFYHGEGFPGVAIDAMNAGIPTLASDWRFNKELILDGINGFTYPYDRYEQLVEKLEFCANNRDLLANMKENCLQESKKYDFDYARSILSEAINNQVKNSQ